MTSVGSILSGAFGQLRERLLAVLAWSAIYAGILFGSWLVMMRQVALLEPGHKNPFGPPPGLFEAMLLTQLVSLFVIMLLFAASMRAALRPNAPGFFWLRLGVEELLLVLLAILFVIAFFVLYLGFFVAFAIAATIGAAMAGIAGGALFIVVGMIAFLCFSCWLQVRLSLTFPLTLIRGRITLGEAWRATRGQFWSLFGAYLVIGLLMILLTVAVSVLAAGPYLTTLWDRGLTPDALGAASAAQIAQQQAGITPLVVVSLVLNGLIGGLGVALGGGAVATAVRDLRLDREGIADAFA